MRLVDQVGGEFERVATSVQQSDVPDSQFAVPAQYKRVRLLDVLDQPQQGS